ncbi:MAG: hypothetical protein ACXADO_06930 [Candidatus Thorarchaeota archaeon]|jgi:hypothetical protein
MDVAAHVKRVAERTKFKREFFIEKNMPTASDNILAIPFYGDLPSTCVLSSFILRAYKELHRDKYIILCSWPGYQALFPYVDEYWSMDDESVTNNLAAGANNLYNTTSLATDISSSLIECLDICTHRDLGKFYNHGFTDQYWQTFGELRRYLPEVPSESRIAEAFRQQLDRREGRKILVYPVIKMRSWQRGKSVSLPVSKEFWSVLCNRLLDEGFAPVIWQNWFTYDLSMEYTDRLTYLVPRSIADVMAAMRYIGLVLDVHSGVSRLAQAARTPFISVDERLRFINELDYVLDDLCCESPRQYIFSFSTMLMTGGAKEWGDSILDNIVARAKSFDTDRDTWGSTNESYEVVSYDRVRQRKSRRLGATFIRSKNT